MIQSLIDESYYVGISSDPHRRLVEHNSGKLKITSNKKPFTLKYLKEYSDYKFARKHEIWLKKKNRIYKNRVAQLAPPITGGVN